MDFFFNSSSSLGVIENSASSDLFLFEFLKCFSIATAPNGIEARAVSIVLVWSDKPIKLFLKIFLSLTILERLAWSCGVGYSETQCKIITLLWYLFIVLMHSLTSLKLEAPVDTIIGFLVFAILSTKLRSVFSNEASWGACRPHTTVYAEYRTPCMQTATRRT